MGGDESERPRGLVVAAAGDDDRAEPVEGRPAALPVGVGEERVTGAAGAVSGERAVVLRGHLLGRDELGGRLSLSELVEERAVRILRPVREVACQPVQHDRGAALGDREGVAPEAECEPERDRGHGERIEALARRVVVLPGHPDDDCVEWPVDPDCASRDPAQERLRMRDRWGAGERGHGGELAREVVEQPAADAGGQEREAP